jgi:type I restriction enzyme M protein
MNQGEIESKIWSIADLIRDTFKRGKYQDVILPLTVLRRLDCVLADKKQHVLDTKAKFEGKLDNPDKQLRRASGFAFYNTSPFDFARICAESGNTAANLRHFIAGFSPNMREVIEKFDFDNTISKLDEAGLLFKVVECFKNLDLHPDYVPNHQMGMIFESLIRRFNEALNENPGEHFTPRDVVQLMVDLLLAGDEERLAKEGVVITVYDPCCGSGGMLTIAKEHVTEGVKRGGTLVRGPLAAHAEVHLFGQEVNPETFAVCKSDLFMKSEKGEDAERIAFGSVLSNDRHADMRFDYLIANPPYGKDWKRDEDAVKAERDRGTSGRFPHVPRISDGQLLFLEHMLWHMKPPEEGGSRVAIIMNGSPLFTGDAGSGESEIRRWILENDWLEALIALPEQLFYNTGIATYVWVLTNRKAPERKGNVLLIDASHFDGDAKRGLFSTRMKNLGSKTREIPLEKGLEIEALLRAWQSDVVRRFERNGSSREITVTKLLPTSYFGYRKITVERPLRLDFQASPERIARLDDEAGFRGLAISKKRGAAGEEEAAAGRERQEAIRAALRTIPDQLFLDRPAFEAVLDAALSAAGLRLAAPVRKAVLSALSARNQKAEICRDRSGEPEPDPELRDTENVPLSESIDAFFDREVRPHVEDAWIDRSKRDAKDGEVGLVGYEINFNRYFYVYEPPRPLAEIEAEIEAVEADVLAMLKSVRNVGK